MGNINNNFRRFQTYKSINSENGFKRDFMEQNYKVDKQLEEKNDLEKKHELPKQDNAFLKNASRLSINNKGQFIKK